MATTYETLALPYWTGTVAAGDAKVLLIPDAWYRTRNALIRHGVMVVGKPGGGGSVLAENSLSAAAVVEIGSGIFNAWSHGTATAQKQDRIEGVITAVRLTATTADAIFEVRM